MIRVGYGYDVHELTAGRELFLCGEKIEYEKGLLGHSDADVAIHALCDALLGAAALGDIGKHFPDTDERYRGISSITLLKEVVRLIGEKGYSVVNADITIAAQRPKLSPYIEKMRGNTAQAMGIDADFVSVKATTTEGLGFVGRGEGISAASVVLIEKN